MRKEVSQKRCLKTSVLYIYILRRNERYVNEKNAKCTDISIHIKKSLTHSMRKEVSQKKCL